jgi:hypothetical protein
MGSALMRILFGSIITIDPRSKAYRTSLRRRAAVATQIQTSDYQRSVEKVCPRASTTHCQREECRSQYRRTPRRDLLRRFGRQLRCRLRMPTRSLERVRNLDRFQQDALRGLVKLDCRSEISRHSENRQFSFAYSARRVTQGFANVFLLEVRVIGQNLLRSHSVGNHADDAR